LNDDFFFLPGVVSAIFLFFFIYFYSFHTIPEITTLFPSDIFLQRVLVWCLCRPGQHSIGLKQVRLDGCLHLFWFFFFFSVFFVLIQLTWLHAFWKAGY
jgi:hypothetical protein